MDTTQHDWPEPDPDTIVLQRIGRGESTTQDQLYVAVKFEELRKLKEAAHAEV